MKVASTWCQETRVPLQLLGKTLRLLLVSVTCLFLRFFFFLMWTIFKAFFWVYYSIVSVLCFGIFGREMCQTLPPYVHGYSVAKSSLTLYDSMAYSSLGSSVPGISQVRILEWVAIPISRGSSRPGDRTCISRISCAGRQILYLCSTWEALSSLTRDQPRTPCTGRWRLNYWTSRDVPTCLISSLNDLGLHSVMESDRTLMYLLWALPLCVLPGRESFIYLINYKPQ